MINLISNPLDTSLRSSSREGHLVISKYNTLTWELSRMSRKTCKVMPKSCANALRVMLFSGVLTFAGCSVNPVKVTPTTLPNGKVSCTLPSFGITALPDLRDVNEQTTALSTIDSALSKAAPLTAAELSQVLAKISQYHRSQWEASIARIKRRTSEGGYDDRLPAALHGNKVIYSAINLLSYRSLTTVNAVIQLMSTEDFHVVRSADGLAFDTGVTDLADHSKLKAIRAQPLFMTETDKTAVVTAMAGAIKFTQPATLYSGDFTDLYNAMVSVHDQNDTSRNEWDRIVQYESYYFNGTFADRFGTSLAKPSLSLTVSDQEIAGGLTALLEAIADDITADLFPVPVWASDTPYTYENKTGTQLTAAKMATALQTVLAAKPPSGIAVGPVPVNGSSFTLTDTSGKGFESGAAVGVHEGTGTIDDKVTTEGQVDTITLGGSFATGDSVIETVQGTAYNYTNNTGSTLTAAQMATALQNMLVSRPPANVTVDGISGSSFVLRATTENGSFTSAGQVGIHQGSGTIDDKITYKRAQVDTITLSGSFSKDDSVIEYIYGSYYPGNGSTKPSVVAYAERDIPHRTILQPMVDSGCGMTTVKGDVLNYLSGKASTWASGESGLVLALFGGTNAGLPIVLWKVSIGDSKTLQTIVQTVLATAAKRATYQASLPLVWAIDQPTNATVPDLIDKLIFKSQ